MISSARIANFQFIYIQGDRKIEKKLSYLNNSLPWILKEDKNKTKEISAD